MNKYYAFSQEGMDALRRIEARLFDPCTLSPDQRRDLANLMHVVLNDAAEFDDNDVASAKGESPRAK